MSKINRHIEGLKKGGLKYFYKVLIDMWPHRLLSTGQVVLVAKELFNLNPAIGEEYTGRLASMDDLDSLADFGNVFDRNRCEYQLKRGDPCVMIFKGNKLVMSGWGAIGKLYCRTNGAIVDTSADGYYVYGGYTIQEERRKGLASLAQKITADHYAAQKRNKMLVLIDPKNTASITMHKNHGFDIIGHSRYYWVFGNIIRVNRFWPGSEKKVRIFTKHPPDGYDWV